MRTKLWNGWEIVDKIGEGRTGDVYRAVKKLDGMNLYCAIKYISLPRNISELDELVKCGVINDKSEAINYYSKIIEDIKKEISIMQKFNNSSYIINCFDYYQETKVNGTGFDFYLRMELATEITSYFNNKKDITLDIIQLGIDICTSLELLCKEGIIHKDIKPNNIFIGSDGKFKLGDFGIADSLNKSDNKITGTYGYMAPEVYNKQKVDKSTDLYSLGLVMYYFLNNNKFPFVSKLIKENNAFKIRMSGMTLPKIKKVVPDLMNIILKACSYENNTRYKNPTEMKRDLESLKEKINNNTNDNKKSNTVLNTLPNIVLNLSTNNPLKTSPIKLDKTIYDVKKLASTNQNSIKSNGSDNISPSLDKTISIYDAKKLESIDLDTLKNNTSNNVSPSFDKTISIYDAKKLENELENKSVTLDNSKKNNINQENKNILNKNNKIKEKVKKIINGSKSITSNFSNLKNNLSNKIKDKNFWKKNQKKIIFIAIVIILILFLKGCAFSEKKCKDGYINSFGICVKGWYTCSKGYSLNNDNKCSKTLKSIDANVKYTCEDDYILQDKLCIKNETKEPKLAYQCAGLGTLKGNKCVQEQSTDAAVTYTCPSGYLYYDGNCSTISNEKAKTTYSCPSGYKLSGTKCTKTEYTNPITNEGTYKCNSGETLNNGKCYKNATCTSNPIYDYCKWYPYYPGCNNSSQQTCSCPVGYIKSGTQCYRNATYSAGNQYCSKGTLSGGKCVYTTTTNASTKYTCPSGYKVYGNQCLKTSSKKPSEKYYCASGLTLKGNQCVTSISVDAIQGYECEDGYILAGNTCVFNDQKDAEAEYSCSKVYSLNGNKCEKYSIKNPIVHYGEKK